MVVNVRGVIEMTDNVLVEVVNFVVPLLPWTLVGTGRPLIGLVPSAVVDGSAAGRPLIGFKPAGLDGCAELDVSSLIGAYAKKVEV